MEYVSPQFILFCLALMLATLGYALYKIRLADRQGDQIPESSARWAIVSAFLVCAVAFAQVTMDSLRGKTVAVDMTQNAVHPVPARVELGKP